MRARRWLLVPVLALCACGGNTSTNPTLDWIAIKAATPPTGTVLKAGETVTFTVSVDATVVSADTGIVRMLVTTEGMVPLNNGTAGPPKQTVPKGTTTVALTDTVTIPLELSGSSVLVVVPIWIDGVQRTGQWGRLAYTVQ